jgi:hypothetical protein
LSLGGPFASAPQTAASEKTGSRRSAAGRRRDDCCDRNSAVSSA